MNVDQELRKAFQELQSKMVSTQQQLKVSDMQIDQLKRAKTHSKLVEGEIKNCPDGTRTYEGVGRMFLLQPVETVQKNLQDKAKASDVKIKSIESSKVYLEKSLKESEDSLRELVLTKQKDRS